MLIPDDAFTELKEYYENIEQQADIKLETLANLDEFCVRHSSSFYEIEGNSITGGNIVRIPASRYSNSSVI